MPPNYTSLRGLLFRPWQSIIVLVVFMVNSLGPLPSAQAQDFFLPAPGRMVSLSPSINSPILKGLKVHPDQPFRLDFILDQGNSTVIPAKAGILNREQLKAESTKLIKYFLASLTIPEKDLWVNLSPYEKNRIVPQSFGLTEMGRDLLAEDYMLKQITASLIYPEGETGKKFWKRIYEEAAKKFGTTNIPMNTFNKVWIVPEKAVVYENAKAGTAYVVDAKLKVMLEEDYLSVQKHQKGTGPRISGPLSTSTSAIGSEILREIVIPELDHEVNDGANFTQLRQVYNSLILATWYKKKIKDSILEQVYADKNKVSGVGYEESVILRSKATKDLNRLKDSSTTPQNDTELIYQRYLQAFKKGVYNYIKETETTDGVSVPRKYFSGGFDGEKLDRVESFISNGNQITDSSTNLAMVSTDMDPVDDQAMKIQDHAMFAGILYQPPEFYNYHFLRQLWRQRQREAYKGWWIAFDMDRSGRLKKNESEAALKILDELILNRLSFGVARFFGTKNAFYMPYHEEGYIHIPFGWSEETLGNVLLEFREEVKKETGQTVSCAAIKAQDIVAETQEGKINSEYRLDVIEEVFENLLRKAKDSPAGGNTTIFYDTKDAQIAKWWQALVNVLKEQSGHPRKGPGMRQFAFVRIKEGMDLVVSHFRNEKATVDQGKPQFLGYSNKALLMAYGNRMYYVLWDTFEGGLLQPTVQGDKFIELESCGLSPKFIRWKDIEDHESPALDWWHYALELEKIYPERFQAKFVAELIEDLVDHGIFFSYLNPEDVMIGRINRDGILLPTMAYVVNVGRMRERHVTRELLLEQYIVSINRPGWKRLDPQQLILKRLRRRLSQMQAIPVNAVNGSQSSEDLAMLHRGGIDLTPARLKVKVKTEKFTDDNGIKFHLDPATLARLQNASGFVPVIIRIQPMMNLRQFLGVSSD